MSRRVPREATLPRSDALSGVFVAMSFNASCLAGCNVHPIPRPLDVVDLRGIHLELRMGLLRDWGSTSCVPHGTLRCESRGEHAAARQSSPAQTERPTAHVTPEKILHTGLAFWASKTLLSAVEMGVFSELAHGPQGFEALRGRLGLHPRAARDFFDALTALGFLKKTSDTSAARAVRAFCLRASWRSRPRTRRDH
jgi:hypothetical protein